MIENRDSRNKTHVFAEVPQQDGVVLVVDFSRANSRYLVHENYISKYETNPVVEVLRELPHENRVKLFPVQFVGQLAQSELAFLQQQMQDTNRTDQAQIQLKIKDLVQKFQQVQLYSNVHIRLWAQHHFPFYRVQSTDVIQEPRVATDNRVYREALNEDALRLCALCARSPGWLPSRTL